METATAAGHSMNAIIRAAQTPSSSYGEEVTLRARGKPSQAAILHGPLLRRDNLHHPFPAKAVTITAAPGHMLVGRVLS